MAMQRQEPRRDGGQPRRQRKRRSLPDCDIYMRTGVCVLGMTCLFNHPPECQQLQSFQQKLDDLGPVEHPESLSQSENIQKALQLGAKGELAAAGDIHSHDAGRPCSLDPSSSSSAKVYSLGQRGDCSRLDSCTELENVIDALLPGNKVSMEQEELATPSNLSAYFSAGDIHSHDTGPSCSLDTSSSSSPKYFSAVDAVQRSGCSWLDSSSELESVIEDSSVHWSELRSSNDSDGTGESSSEIFDNDAGGNRESNREIFESLRLLPKYRRWLECDVAPGDIFLGSKIAEGGQAEIFEVKFRSKRAIFRCVLKVFKKGYSLQDLKSQWPHGLLSEGQLSMLFHGGMVLEDDRFAFLLLRSEMDLRKLIDITLDKYSPLFDHDGRPRLEELRAYKSKCARSECSTPVFSEKCAKGIMARIALQMKYLHSVYILHRDLKASNILCSSGMLIGTIIMCVADYESSIGVVGTAFWRAPEILKQLKERQPVHFTREADVYGFAMTCYEIWTGHIPFEEYKSYDYDHVLNGARPTLPAHVPSWVKDLIQRCWHQNPSERPSFSAIVKELRSRSIFIPMQLARHSDAFFANLTAVRMERAPEV